MNRCSVFVIALLLNGTLAAEPGAPTIRLSPKGGTRTSATFDVIGLDAADLANLARVKPEDGVWIPLFAVTVAESALKGEKNPPVLGSYQIEDGVIRFTPRFPPAPGVRYRAVFDPARLPGRTGGNRTAVVTELMVPKPNATPTTVVRQVYPTRATLPENQLKFYLHFSAPMSRGEPYRHIRLLDASGKPVAFPFLELDQELWDPSGQRFTLLFEPGRIKRGLKPREEAGPTLIEGQQYTLEIDRAWLDGHGNPLKEPFRKTFRVAAPDDQPPDPKTWQLRAPAAGKLKPLTVVFPKPMDQALLQRLLWVTDAAGQKVAGQVTVSDEETHWSFTPDTAWRPGRYQLVADTRLEDLAGNSIGKPFEVDVFRPVQREVKKETVQRSFQVGP